MVPFTFGELKVETVGETSAFDETKAQLAKNKEAVAANMTKTENLLLQKEKPAVLKNQCPWLMKLELKKQIWTEK